MIARQRQRGKRSLYKRGGQSHNSSRNDGINHGVRRTRCRTDTPTAPDRLTTHHNGGGLTPLASVMTEVLVTGESEVELMGGANVVVSMGGPHLVKLEVGVAWEVVSEVVLGVVVSTVDVTVVMDEADRVLTVNKTNGQ